LQEESTRLKQDRKKLSRVPRFGFTVIAALLLALLARTPARGEPAGNLILRGAAIYTLDAARPWASALVIQNGRIGYVGDDTGALAFAGPGTRALALGGRMVIPGFHDSHIHPMTGGMRLLRCRLNDFRAAQQVYAAVRACAAAKPKGTWLLGGGWSPEAFARGGPSRRKLDELVPDRPALLTTEDGYTAWVNTSALALAGIATDGSGSQVEGIERDPTTHKPTGILKDEAVSFVRRHAPQPTEAEYREALRRSTAIANRFGITSLVDANAGEPVLDAYRAAEVAGELTVRVVAAQRIDLSRGVIRMKERLACAATCWSNRKRWLPWCAAWTRTAFSSTCMRWATRPCVPASMRSSSPFEPTGNATGVISWRMSAWPVLMTSCALAGWTSQPISSRSGPRRRIRRANRPRRRSDPRARVGCCRWQASRPPVEGSSRAAIGPHRR
ncbi:MAG: hypothetical protein E6J64_22675, partial [Deltaproteobacteria bacterium]